MSVIDSRTIESVMPLLKTVVQASGIQVNIDMQKPAKITHHSGRMISSIVGARLADAIAGGGGSIVARGSRLESRFRIPGRMSSAATMIANGIDGTTAAFQKLFGGM